MSASTPRANPHRTSAHRWWPWIVALALLLRLAHMPGRWCTTAWLYAAYPWDTLTALRQAAMPAFTGLHPPLWPLLHALAELVAPVPLLWLLGSVVASTLAVAAIARVSPLAGLLVATSPVQLAYAAEVNGYPLAVACLAVVLASRDRAAAGAWLVMGIAACLAVWTHVLAGVGAGLVALTLPRGMAVRVLVLMVVASGPLLWPVLMLLGDGAAAVQPAFRANLVVEAFIDRFGLLWLGLIPAVVQGARRRPWLLVPAIGLLLALVGLTALRIAAPHQFPYWTLVGLPLALLAGSVRHRAVVALVIGVAVAQGGVSLSYDLGRTRHLIDDQSRPQAIDTAVSELSAPWFCTAVPDGGAAPTPSCTGDALYVVDPRVLDDDDKRSTTPALWRLPPWRAMPAISPYAFDWADYRHGQPRLVHLGDAQHVVYVEDHVRDALLQAAAAHPRLFVVMLSAPDSGPERRMRALLGQDPEVIGDQLLWRLERSGP